MFWTIAHLAYHQQTLAEIRNKVRLAYEDGKLNEEYLAEHCPRLDSIISDILRLTAASALVREVIAPNMIGDKQLLPGNRLLVSKFTLHM
jgi:cytochrome P450